MELKHTHRTDFIRGDFDLAALHVILLFNGTQPTPSAIEDFEGKYRGNAHFEKALSAAAAFLQEFNPAFVAKPHQCGGQLCDQDGLVDTALVVKKPDDSQKN